MAEVRGKAFIYKNSLEWQGERKGTIYSDRKPGFRISIPPEFKGHPGIWSPEDLFVASVNSFIMNINIINRESMKK